MYHIDLNCDMGESFGAYRLGDDEELLKVVTSASIACGFHAGDPQTMRKTVDFALGHGVRIGAHPGLPDLVGFGRREMDVSPPEVKDMVVYQIGALDGFVKASGGRMQHVKPHGALYNMAAKNRKLAEAIAEAIYRMNPELILFGLAGSELIRAGERRGLRVASEVFADRTYQQDGSLTPRRQPGALVADRDQAINQIVRIIKEGKVMSQQGVDVPVKADTVCIHGDHPDALGFARRIREQLEASHISIRAIGDNGRS